MKLLTQRLPAAHEALRQPVKRWLVEPLLKQKPMRKPRHVQLHRLPERQCLLAAPQPLERLKRVEHPLLLVPLREKRLDCVVEFVHESQ